MLIVIESLHFHVLFLLSNVLQNIIMIDMPLRRIRTKMEKYFWKIFNRLRIIKDKINGSMLRITNYN